MWERMDFEYLIFIIIVHIVYGLKESRRFDLITRVLLTIIFYLPIGHQILVGLYNPII